MRDDNLPTINGMMQKEGKEFKAGNVTYNASPYKISFSLNLAGAYPDEAMVRSWIRSYEFIRRKGLKIKDSYNLKTVKKPSVLSFMVCSEPVLVKTGIVNLANPSGQKIKLCYNPGELEFSYETLPQTDNNLKGVWGNNLYRILLKSKSEKNKGDFDIKIQVVD